ncbi:Transmembrane protein 65 [Sarcoptes scabiei]|uniref:Transmembrane protein 65 n=1 Tax=Sarcoptes scabiei TaxID=52283 RepID=A0A834VEY8_SARSC|nr:Transmembrane protein 65 [Sarcoptes scabiei]
MKMFLSFYSRSFSYCLSSKLFSKSSRLRPLEWIRCKHNQSFLTDKERVKSFLALLNPNERKILWDELRNLPEISQISKDSSPNLTIVQDGAMKTTEDLKLKDEKPPSFRQLGQLFLVHSLPFVGFGFLDNLLMIVAGDYIDLTIGVALGISTMAAAGLGNALSDIAGVGSAYYVEMIAAKIGVESPKLSFNQLQMRRTRWLVQISRAIGVAIGCLIGMLPLIFLPHRNETEKISQKK